VGLSAHVRREGSRLLSEKTPSPVQFRRVAVAESFLSVKPSTRGKTSSPRGTLLSAKEGNLVVCSEDPVRRRRPPGFATTRYIEVFHGAWTTR
jgi:hypothetical protein